MKAASAGFDAHLQQEVTSLATCWKVKRTDGVIIAATSLDIDVPYDLASDGEGDGELMYKAATGYNRSALENTADFKIGNMELQGLIESTTITKEDIRAEIYDFAQVWIFQVNWKDLSDGELAMQHGYLGQISLRNDIFVAEFRDLLDLFLTEIGDIVTEDCPLDLFDDKCRVQELPIDWAPSTAYTVTNTQAVEIGSYISADAQSRLLTESGDGILLEDDSGSLLLETANANRIFRCIVGGTSSATPPTWNLTIGGSTVEAGGVTWEALQANQNLVRVTGVSVSRRVFTVEAIGPALDAPDIHFQEGTLAFSEGLNALLAMKREIKKWTLSTQTVELWRPMPFDVVVGDVLTLFAGCTKSSARCTQFFNHDNNRGWLKVPGNNKMMETPSGPS